ncbi:ribosomal protein S18-alanine N-acetyltransferase [Pseudidiomarina insulisalsae]|uniref:[Ribosomal protein bS18]-alanine N-acetyltransferase n=1 Tax=Pseudidiomarina insulisalsae TaxID=575789 RepID=A0A432Y8L3_9GAMM|nr:ribosomal protein S18-alanine N-acetyltransferase [Pseudidiomarina insulisalsae]RUO57314.1 ribosomal-protein-alanine N-acetyltransferase [Pseudidiomarina insulisalsae]
MIKLLQDFCPELNVIERASQVEPWTESNLQSCFQPGYQVFGWFDSTAGLVGFYITHAVCDELTLMNIAVHPDWQQQGIGRELLEHLLAGARAEHMTVWLEVRVSNTAAIHLYRRLGFHEVGRRPDYYPLKSGREDALIMSRIASGSPI